MARRDGEDGPEDGPENSAKDSLQDALRGFCSPLDPTGQAALYGPPPWRFRGRSLTVLARCEPGAIAALTPAPLAPMDGDLVRFTVHELVCDLGFGRAFADRHPERSRVREAVVAICARHEGVPGFYDPFLWCDSDAEIAVGREMFGWPQVGADLWLTPPDPVEGLRAGDALVGRVARLGRPVLDLEIAVTGPGDLPAAAPAFATFYTMRVIPDPAGGPTIREVYASEMQDVRIGAPMRGEGRLSLQAPELAALRPREIVGARANAIAWTKHASRRIARIEQAR